MSSTVIAKNIQIGTSGTASNNFNWYQPAAPDGTVRLGVGNYGATTLDVITANSSGNVGIGTSSPGYRLDVQQSTTGILSYFKNNSSSAQNGNVVAANDAGTALRMQVFGSAAGSYGMLSAGSPALYTSASELNFVADNASGVIKWGLNGSSEQMRLTSTGLGIGTSLPTQKLHVASSTAPYIALDGTGGTSARLWSIQNRPDVSGAFWIRDETAGATRVAIDSSGNFQFNSGYGSVATAYGCRAWVNFNGTGTVAIRASGNVSSISDNGGLGDYTINFTNAMPDANYCAAMSGGEGVPGSGGRVPASAGQTTTTLRIQVRNLDNAGADAEFVNVAIFR